MPKKTYRSLIEDEGGGGGAPVNNASGGNIAGLPPDDPPIFNRKNKKKRKKLAGCEVFEIDSDRYNRCKNIKTRYEDYSRLVGVDEVGIEIREYAQANPRKSIIIQNESTGVMTYLKLGTK
jgi:hypothetical protein